jgi:hypothetical protein
VLLPSTTGLQAGHCGRLCAHALSYFRLGQSGIITRLQEYIEEREFVF